MKLLFTLFLSAFLCFVVSAQAPNILWKQTVGGSAYDQATSVDVTSDDGFIVAGNTSSNNISINGNIIVNHGGSDGLIIKYNTSNNAEWAFSYGGAGEDNINSIHQTKDGGYIVAGYTTSNLPNYHGNTDMWIFKLNNTGTQMLWEKVYGGSAIDIANSVRQDVDDNYIVAGYSASNDGNVTNHRGGNDFWILKLANSDGGMIWQKTLGGTNDDAANDIQIAPDGGYVVAGYTQSVSASGDVIFNHGMLDVWVVKLDPNRNIVANKTYGGSANDVARSIEKTNEGGYILAGGTNSSNSGDVTGSRTSTDFWILKLNSNINFTWQRSYNPLSTTSYDIANSVKPTSDGGYVVAGYGLTGTGDYLMIKLNSSGSTVLWNKSFGGSVLDQANSLQITKDGDFLVVGHSFSTDGDIGTSNNGGADFWIVKLGSLKAQYAWDKSFPTTPLIKPKGIAADGVARIYIKIPYLIAQSIKITLSDNEGASTGTNMLGKIMASTENPTYAEEQQVTIPPDGTPEPGISTTNVNGVFWFRYVAPDDFSETGTSSFANASERKVKLHIEATRSDNTLEIVDSLLTIVRPPLMLVHGLGGGVDTWEKFKYSGNSEILFTQSPLFKRVKAITLPPHPHFSVNADLILNPEANGNTNRENTFQGNIESLRNLGFACNQVDYICHSMGGCVLRTTIALKRNKFYGVGNEIYKNYSKGFVHKAITLNTPHDGTPIADAIARIIPLTPLGLTRAAFEASLLANKNQFEIQRFSNNSYKLVATDATVDLQVSNYTTKFPQTDVKNHLIAGDVDIFDLDDADLPKELAAGNVLLDLLSKVLRDNTDRTTRDYIVNHILSFDDLDDRVLLFMNWFSGKYGFINFWGQGDAVVPLKSQLAGTENESLSKKIFHNSNTNNPNDIDADHISLKGQINVGDHIKMLLNSSINTLANPLFSSSIPATVSPQIVTIPIIPATINETTSDAKIKIGTVAARSISYMDTLYLGDTVSLSFSLMDTSKLAYIDIRFQSQSITSISRNSSQSVTFKVDSINLGRQTFYARAIYDQTNSVDYFTDTLTVYIASHTPPSQFIIEPATTSLQKNDFFTPDYYVLYNNHRTPLANSNESISIVIADTSKIKYDKDIYSFTALSDTGSTYAIGTYMGLKDTIFFTITPGIYYGCTNKTIASGNWNNPAVWEKGTVPNTCDSVVIMPGNTVTFNSSAQIRALNISLGSTLNITDSTKTLQIGEADDGNRYFVNNGTLNFSAGKLIINGRLQQTAGSTFSMTGGNLIIDGNTGFTETSVPSGLHLFDVSASMSNFSFTGGTLQFIDPPIGEGGQTISCPYNFGDNSTLIFGDGISTTISANANGFGGNLLPAQVGRIVLDAATAGNNRIFKNLNPLTIKSSCQVKSGNLVQSALLRVVQ